MATCFLFAQHFDEDYCLSLRLDQEGQVDAPLARRLIDEVRALQNNSYTLVVVPAISSSLHDVELLWLSERKARAAIPYALEDHLAQNVRHLHFAFDRKHYQDNHYLVSVTDKQFLLDLIAKLNAFNLEFDGLTLDWFALSMGEACVAEDGLLVYDNTFKGALSIELANIYLKGHPNYSSILMFDDSAPALQNPSFTRVEGSSHLWIARRLLQGNWINLCQGELQHDTRQETSKYWYRASAILAGLGLATSILINIINLQVLRSKIVDLDQKIAVIYREFFPQAQRVISPKFRISQFLKSDLTGHEVPFWTLLEKLAQSYDMGRTTMEQLRFQNPVLYVTILGKDFAALEDLQLSLQQAKVKVTQTQASSRKQKVVATLELSL